MLRRTMLIRLVAMAALATAAWAADVTGKWSAQMNGPDGGGGMTMTFTFKQSGTKLTGSVDGPGGEPMQIQNGKVDGDKISFAISFNEMKIEHEGVVKGDEITLTMKMDGGPGGGPGPMVLKRVQ